MPPHRPSKTPVAPRPLRALQPLKPKPKLHIADTLLICCACGTQYDVKESDAIKVMERLREKERVRAERERIRLERERVEWEKERERERMEKERVERMRVEREMARAAAAQVAGEDGDGEGDGEDAEGDTDGDEDEEEEGDVEVIGSRVIGNSNGNGESAGGNVVEDVDEPESTPGAWKGVCRICEDPRQFVPSTGQAFTTLRTMRWEGRRNMWRQAAYDKRVWEIWTEPKFGIGQRALLLQTEHGNVLWDCVAFLDQETIDHINYFGTLSAIVISHPHFYTTYLDWAQTFHCPLYLSRVDAVAWANRTSNPAFKAHVKLLGKRHNAIIEGVTAIICGGHFDGSMVLRWDDGKGGTLCLADTIMTTVASQATKPTPEGHNSYSFLFSIPNMVPLDPDTIMRIWKSIKPFGFTTTIGNVGMNGAMYVSDVEGDKDALSVKARVLESAKIAVRRMGWTEHAMLQETVSMAPL